MINGLSVCSLLKFRSDYHFLLRLLEVILGQLVMPAYSALWKTKIAVSHPQPERVCAEN